MSRFEEQFLDVVEAGHRLGIHPESVKRLIRRGRLPAQKFGSKWFVPREELELFASRYLPHPGRRPTLF